MLHFTPGPWVNNNGNISGQWPDGERVALAIVGVTRFCGSECAGKKAKRMRAEDAANAKLIAIAPDMWHLLQDIKDGAFNGCDLGLAHEIRKLEQRML